MTEKVYMLNSYIMDGDSFLFNDNHGVVVRCDDCRYHDMRMHRCTLNPGEWYGTEFCSKGQRKENLKHECFNEES